MTKAIFYLTFNGIFNNTNGIGTQTKTLLSGLLTHIKYFKSRYGDFELHLVAPTYDSYTWGYSLHDVEFAERAISTIGGEIHFCPFQVDLHEFWTIKNWEALSVAGATTVLANASKFSQSLVIAIDPPFLLSPLLIARAKKNFDLRIDSLLVLYGTSYIQTKPLIDTERLGWEYKGISSARLYEEIKIGRICQSMQDHLVHFFGAPKEQFVPYESSLSFENEDFSPMTDDKVDLVLKNYNIPRNKDIILAFGRAEWLKGFDILIRSMNGLSDQVHLVLIVVPFSHDDPIISEYKSLIARHNVCSTLIVGYNRELPRSLCQYPRTRIVICPSRGETFSNIPLEVGLWAKEKGPVVLCSKIDGFIEQIIDGHNGFLFSSESEVDLRSCIELILNLNPKTIDSIRNNAFDRVRKERNFVTNLTTTLDYFW